MMGFTELLLLLLCLHGATCAVVQWAELDEAKVKLKHLFPLF